MSYQTSAGRRRDWNRQDFHHGDPSDPRSRAYDPYSFETPDIPHHSEIAEYHDQQTVLHHQTESLDRLLLLMRHNVVDGLQHGAHNDGQHRYREGHGGTEDAHHAMETISQMAYALNHADSMRRPQTAQVIHTVAREIVHLLSITGAITHDCYADVMETLREERLSHV
jgi:hypothetical protein